MSSNETTTTPRPVEEIAGDAMAALLQLALRSLKQREGEVAALSTMEQLEDGSAQVLVRVAIGSKSTRFVGHLHTASDQVVPLIDIEVLRVDRTH